jgi:folate-dependent phosphoribosylglycinamide formyltransferase PurN
LQKKCVVCTNETITSLREKIHSLEFRYFPETIEKIVLK